MSTSLETKCTSQIAQTHARTQVPLTKCEPQEVKTGRMSLKLD